MRALKTAVCLERSPAVSGMAFYNSDVFPQWKNKLFIGALKEKDVIVLSVKGNSVTEDGRILGDKDQRIRDVRVGPDGYLYVLTDETAGSFGKQPAGNQDRDHHHVAAS
ncbi:soluble aldose sugar dehydrogenase YliI domain protein [Enterobacter hormaechei subsp. xiangfangensis]|nr:soluble aldose sugar dehydrogenase YliI domain protein [Enterobacter hormaechei subsp. xiangfangensis]